MENKNLRPSVSSEIKPTKSEQSSLTGKFLNRNNKKKESGVLPKNAVGNTSTGNVSGGFKNQNYLQPKQKWTDKKQQRAGVGYAGFGTSRKNDYQITDSTDPDLDLVLSEKSKKQDLAHLLNMKFQFAPRDNSASHYWRATHPRVGERARKFSYYSGRAHLNKDHYLQANCQFVVKEDGDYTVYQADPDLLVPWESIEQIRIWGSEVGSCPICLHSPVAAKMTRCGHIYCWPCILHFLALSDKPSRPCPICDVSVRIHDLKSVVALEQRNLKVGDVLEMRLMKRDRHSLQPQMVSRAKGSTVNTEIRKPCYLGEAGEEHVFSKLLLCTPNDVVNLILHWEKSELLQQLEAEKDCPESCFIQQALDLLALRHNNTCHASISSVTDNLKFESSKANTLLVGNETPALETAVAFDESCPLQSTEVDEPSLNVISDEHSETSSCHSGSQMLFSNVHHPPVQENNAPKSTFYFYQSSDGQAIYLHPINIQILVRSYGSLELCPEKIEGRILESENLSMSEELRNRLRYLGHIPISKQFQLTEIALTQPVIDLDIMDEFKERIEERARRRRRKDREERRRDLEIQKAEDAKWGRTKSQPIARLDSQVHFPGFSPSSLEPDLPKFTEEIAIEVSPSSIESGSDRHCSSGLSFAQMLREGKTKVPHVWSGLPKRESTLESVHASTGKPRRHANDSESESENLDYTPVPEYKDTFSSALAAALDQAAKAKGVSKAADGTDDGRNPKKNKKRNKQKVLFSTGMNFM